MRLPPISYSVEDKSRQYPHSQKDDDERFDFEVDRSRVIHSAAFRRLQGKTQVFAPDQSDFYRTRLTHSLETAQIAKGLALRLGADVDLCEASALLHDIGHPPFGHRGERVLQELMAGSGGFEANAQNLRVLALLEEKFPDCKGLNLTRAVLDGAFKYKEEFDGSQKSHFYYEGDCTASWLLEVGGRTRSFECSIIDYADDIAYAVHDFEDGVKAGLIEERRVQEQYDSILEYGNRRRLDFSRREINWCIRQLHDLTMPETKMSTNVAAKMKTSALINVFINTTKRTDVDKPPTSSERYCYKLLPDPECARQIAALKALDYCLAISDQSVHTLEVRASTILTRLFEYYRQQDSINAYPSRFRASFEEAGGSDEKRARVACDYISGMTDDYAQRLYRRLFTADRVALHDF